MHLKLMQAGFAVYNPILSMCLPWNWPYCDAVSHDAWLASDLIWIDVSHAVYRMPGESIGGDIETKYAAKIGVPVFYDMKTLVDHFKNSWAPGEKRWAQFYLNNPLEGTL